MATTGIGAFRQAKPWTLVPEYPDICNSCGAGGVSTFFLVSTWQDKIPEWWCLACIRLILSSSLED